MFIILHRSNFSNLANFRQFVWRCSSNILMNFSSQHWDFSSISSYLEHILMNNYRNFKKDLVHEISFLKFVWFLDKFFITKWEIVTSEVSVTWKNKLLRQYFVLLLFGSLMLSSGREGTTPASRATSLRARSLRWAPGCRSQQSPRSASSRHSTTSPGERPAKADRSW